MQQSPKRSRVGTSSCLARDDADAMTTAVASPASLPLPLFEHIVGFTTSKELDGLVGGRLQSPNDLKRLALVALQWRVPVHEISTQWRLERMELEFKLGSRAEVLAMRRRTQLRGRAVRELTIRMGHFEHESFVLNPGLARLEERRVGWDAIFSLVPRLRRLDLILMPMESRHVAEVLAAAAKHCLQLEELIMPRKKHLQDLPDGPQINLIMTTLNAALERWYTKGNHGGIKKLTVPTRNEVQRLRSSMDFLDHVTHFCPNLQLLDGHTRVIHRMEEVRCEDQLIVPLETWEAFNKSCTDLREFNWVCVPFADPFFRVFGEHVKPKLRKLSLSANLLWDWADYFRQCGGDDNVASVSPSARVSKTGYGGLAVDFGAALKGCPALTELTVSVDQLNNEETEHEQVGEDAYGPVFWEAVARNCPLLNLICVDNCAYRDEYREARPMKGLTDASLLAMADLKHLTSVTLCTAPITGDGVFSYLCRLAKPSVHASPEDLVGKRLSFSLSLAGANSDDSHLPPFYNDLLTLMKRLAETSEEDLGVATLEHKLSMELSNPYRDGIDESLGENYLVKDLKPLVAHVKKTHPSMRLQIVLSKTHDGLLHRVDDVLLSWEPDKASGSTFIEEEYAPEDSMDGGSVFDYGVPFGVRYGSFYVSEEEDDWYSEEDEEFYSDME